MSDPGKRAAQAGIFAALVGELFTVTKWASDAADIRVRIAIGGLFGILFLASSAYLAVKSRQPIPAAIRHRTIDHALDRGGREANEPRLGRLGGPLWVDFEGGLVVERFEVKQILKRVRRPSVVVVRGKPASGKSVVLSTVGYRLRCAWPRRRLVVLISLKEFNHPEGKKELAVIDLAALQRAVLIVDDAHLDPEFVERAIRELPKATILVGTREILFGNEQEVSMGPHGPKLDPPKLNRLTRFEENYRRAIVLDAEEGAALVGGALLQRGAGRASSHASALGKATNLWHMIWLVEAIAKGGERESDLDASVRARVAVHLKTLQREAAGVPIVRPIALLAAFFKHEISVDRVAFETAFGVARESVDWLVGRNEIVQAGRSLSMHHSVLAEIYLDAMRNESTLAGVVPEVSSTEGALYECYLKVDEGAILDILIAYARDGVREKISRLLALPRCREFLDAQLSSLVPSSRSAHAAAALSSWLRASDGLLLSSEARRNLTRSMIGLLTTTDEEVGEAAKDAVHHLRLQMRHEEVEQVRQASLALLSAGGEPARERANSLSIWCWDGSGPASAGAAMELVVVGIERGADASAYSYTIRGAMPWVAEAVRRGLVDRLLKVSGREPVDLHLVALLLEHLPADHGSLPSLRRRGLHRLLLPRGDPGGWQFLRASRGRVPASEVLEAIESRMAATKEPDRLRSVMTWSMRLLQHHEDLPVPSALEEATLRGLCDERDREETLTMLWIASPQVFKSVTIADELISLVTWSGRPEHFERVASSFAIAAGRSNELLEAVLRARDGGNRQVSDFVMIRDCLQQGVRDAEVARGAVSVCIEALSTDPDHGAKRTAAEALANALDIPEVNAEIVAMSCMDALRSADGSLQETLLATLRASAPRTVSVRPLVARALVEASRTGGWHRAEMLRELVGFAGEEPPVPGAKEALIEMLFDPDVEVAQWARRMLPVDLPEALASALLDRAEAHLADGPIQMRVQAMLLVRELAHVPPMTTRASRLTLDALYEGEEGVRTVAARTLAQRASSWEIPPQELVAAARSLIESAHADLVFQGALVLGAAARRLSAEERRVAEALATPLLTQGLHEGRVAAAWALWRLDPKRHAGLGALVDENETLFSRWGVILEREVPLDALEVARSPPPPTPARDATGVGEINRR